MKRVSSTVIPTDSYTDLLGSIDWNISWYKRNARYAKWCYYVLNAMLVLLPLVAAWVDRMKDVKGNEAFLVMLITSAVAGIVGLLAPYRRWKEFKATEIVLNSLRFELITSIEILNGAGGTPPAQTGPVLLEFGKRFERILSGTVTIFFAEQENSSNPPAPKKH